MQTIDYFDKGIAFRQKTIDRDKDSVNSLPLPKGRASSVHSLCERSVMLCIQRYSRGDAIAEIKQSVTQMAQIFGLRYKTILSIDLDKGVREMWENLTLTQLYDNLTCLTFIVSLRYPADDKADVLKWIGHEGEDGLLDRVAVQLGEESRRIAETSKYVDVYDALIAVIDAATEDRSLLLKNYVESWYKRMKIISWHGNHKGEAYVGYWCFEAALVAMLWNIDDSAFANHKNYPADLVKFYRTNPC